MLAAAAVANGNGRTANSNLQANLWEAAKIVAEAATAPAAAFIEPTPAPVPIPRAVPPTPAPAPVAAAPASVAGNGAVATPIVKLAAPAQTGAPQAAQEPYTNYNIPAFIAASKGPIAKYKWLIFGSTAAFLGVIWAAIWFAGAR